MNLDIDVAAAISAEEASLIERARLALLYTNHTFHGGSEIACAVAWPRNGDRPMRIEFKAVPIGGIGQAYLGPDIPLTEELFDGNNFTEEFIQKMKNTFEAFDEYLRQT
jgi:hypothetical protein